MSRIKPFLIILLFSLVCDVPRGMPQVPSPDLPHTENSAFNVRVISTSVVENNEGSFTHEVESIATSGGSSKRIRWIDHANDILSVRLYKSLLIVVGHVADVHSFSIVDLTDGKLKNFIVCRQPSVSPTGRFLSYLDFYPLHAGTQSPGDEVVLYDLEKPQNLQAVQYKERRPDWVWESSSQGVIVYPKVFEGQLCRTPAKISTRWNGRITTPLTWLPDQDALTFSVQNQGKKTNVVVQITARGAVSKTTEVQQ